MARRETRTLYTLAELKASHPDAYARVLARWQDACDRSGEVPWSEEPMDSLRAVVDACGATLKDYSIGPWSHSSVKVDVDNLDECGNLKDDAWLLREVLAPKGYVDKGGNASFPGLCKWTGYCADDDMIESVHKAMVSGDTLTEALEGLAGVVRDHMEDAADQQRSEDSMEENWGDGWFTAEGEDA